MKTIFRIALYAFAALALTAPSARAQSELLPAVEINRAINVVDRLHTTLANLMLSEETQLDRRKALISDTLTKSFDLASMTKAILGSRTWNTMPEEQHGAAVDAFSNWMITQYASRFTASSDPEFLTRETRDGGLNTVVVETQLRTKKKVVSLDYRMRGVDGDFKIIDVFLDGRVSEVALRKSEFRRVIKDSGADGFIAALKAKTAALASPS